jgi:hypothetical protein
MSMSFLSAVPWCLAELGVFTELGLREGHCLLWEASL